jgi:hypothetical protein
MIDKNYWFGERGNGQKGLNHIQKELRYLGIEKDNMTYEEKNMRLSGLWEFANSITSQTTREIYWTKIRKDLDKIGLLEMSLFNPSSQS